MMQHIQAWTEWLQATPVVLLALIVAPLLSLAYLRQTYPHLPLVLLLLFPSLLSFALLAKQDIFPFILAFDAAIAVVAVADVMTIPSKKALAAERHCQRIASLKKKHAVTITVTNNSRQEQRLWLRDDTPEDFEAVPAEMAVRLPPRSRATLHYDILARRRGAFQLDGIHLRLRSRLGLWQRFVTLPCASTIHVYPDMKQLAEYELLARTNRLSLMGVRRTRRVGQDNDFERLRDYTLDDNYKHIDWRSTARRNKLTVKDFQTSQSQRLIFLVDCGRMMTNRTAGLSLLDHAFNAMLMLSYVALRRGDSVGLISFSDQIHSFVPPRGGAKQMNHLLHASFDRFPELVESRYEQAFLHLSKHCRKRSLVILVTNIIDEVNANQVYRYLSTLVGRHLPLGVLLRDYELFSAAEAAWTTDADLYNAAAAAEIICWRHEVLADLHHKGVMALDVFPDAMTAPMINQYLEVKARHLL